MKSNSESNRESNEEFPENHLLEENPEKTPFLTNSKKLIIISILSIIFISLIIVIILLSKGTSEKEIPITCDSGYYLPEDDKSHCLPCLENCKECHGTKDSCICTLCFYSYILDNNICKINHSIKAIYTTSVENETLYLIHYVYLHNLKQMVIDNELINPIDAYMFPDIGNHTIYYSFDNNLETLGEMFYGAESLISISFTPLFNTENITNLNFMFYGCKKLTSIDISHFNTENVIYLSGMFELCYSLLSIDLSSFNTQNVTSMNMMFYGCHSLTSINISHFNTKKLTGMTNMFDSCYNLTKIDLSNFDTKSVYSMSYLFYRCYSLTSIDLSNFSIQKVGFLEGMFRECHSLTSIDLSHFNTENVTEIDYMFYGCENLRYIDISQFSYYENVSLFYDLPENGTIAINNDFISLIDKQIPSNWNIIYKLSLFF